jgi:hypothetical protein
MNQLGGLSQTMIVAKNGGRILPCYRQTCGLDDSHHVRVVAEQLEAIVSGGLIYYLGSVRVMTLNN